MATMRSIIEPVKLELVSGRHVQDICSYIAFSEFYILGAHRAGTGRCAKPVFFTCDLKRVRDGLRVFQPVGRYSGEGELSLVDERRHPGGDRENEKVLGEEHEVAVLPLGDGCGGNNDGDGAQVEDFAERRDVLALPVADRRRQHLELELLLPPDLGALGRDGLVEADGPLRVPAVGMVVLEVLLDLLRGCRVLFEMSERFGEESHQVHEARCWRALLCE